MSDFDESKFQRDDAGKFSSTGGEGKQALAKAIAGKQRGQQQKALEKLRGAKKDVTNAVAKVSFAGERSSKIEISIEGKVLGALNIDWEEKSAIVSDVRVKEAFARKGLATRMYEEAAKHAAERGLPLRSDVSRFPGADAFWQKQVTAGRAEAVKVGPNKVGLDENRVKFYQLNYPPPATLK